MKLKSILFIIFGSIIFGSEISAQQVSAQSESTILISDETLVQLPISSSLINISILASGKSAVEANSGLLQIKKKVEAGLVGSKLVVVKREISSGAGAGNKLSQSAPISIKEDITTVVNEESLAKALDYLLSISQLEINGVNSLKDNLNELKTQASSKAVAQAFQKASQIAKNQSMALGEIIDISVTEEPTASSIRDQLDPTKGENLTNPTEIKIVATLRIRLIVKPNAT